MRLRSTLSWLEYAGSFLSLLSYGIPESALVHGQTMAFIVLNFAQLIHSFNFKSMDKSVFTVGIFKNKFLIYSILLGIILQVIIVSVGQIAKVFIV